MMLIPWKMKPIRRLLENPLCPSYNVRMPLTQNKMFDLHLFIYFFTLGYSVKKNRCWRKFHYTEKFILESNHMDWRGLLKIHPGKNTFHRSSWQPCSKRQMNFIITSGNHLFSSPYNLVWIMVLIKKKNG